MSQLTQAERDALPSSDFAIPGSRSYPIHDIEHARNALARVAEHGTPEERQTVRGAVHKRYPSLREEQID